MNKHLIWGVSIVLSISILCGTLIYINHNAWTMRFEMDNNTKEAIESIDYPIVDNSDNKRTCYSEKCHIDIKNNIQIGGCSMSEVNCELFEDKFALEVIQE